MAFSPENLRGGEGFRGFGLSAAFAAGFACAVFALVTGAFSGAGAGLALGACGLVSAGFGASAAVSAAVGASAGADFGVSSVAIASLHRVGCTSQPQQICPSTTRNSSLFCAAHKNPAFALS
ncbi:MAG: hypothetical protein ACFE0P_00815 [Oceanicaulis sp.]